MDPPLHHSQTATAPTLPIKELSTLAETPAESKPEENETHVKCTHKPSQHVLNILPRHAVGSSHPSDPVVALECKCHPSLNSLASLRGREPQIR